MSRVIDGQGNVGTPESIVSSSSRAMNTPAKAIGYYALAILIGDN
jgi:hypothetical protein